MVLANYVKGYDSGIIGATNSPLLAKYPNMLLDYATVNGSGRIGIIENEPEETEPTTVPAEATEATTEATEGTTVAPTTKPSIGDNAPTGDVSIVLYAVLALSSVCSMGLVIGKKKF